MFSKNYSKQCHRMNSKTMFRQLQLAKILRFYPKKSATVLGSPTSMTFELK